LADANLLEVEVLKHHSFAIRRLADARLLILEVLMNFSD